MYQGSLPEVLHGTTVVDVVYDCCQKPHALKYKDAKKNFDKNSGKHICRSCGLRMNNPAARPEVQAKIKANNLKNYGTTCPLNTPEAIKARTEKMFGTEEAKAKIIEKRRQTNLEKYGVEHQMHREDVKEKVQQTNQERYGGHPMQNEEVQAKARKTTFDRYGVENVLSDPQVRLRAAETMLERYGVDHYNQLPEMQEYMKENCKDWLRDSWEAGGPNKGKPRPEEWTEKQRETVLALIQAGEWKACFPQTKKGFFSGKKSTKRAYYRSSYELLVLCWLEDNGDVEWYTHEPFRINYQWEGKNRAYIPDFVFKCKNQPDPVILELKASFLKDHGQVLAKNDAAVFFAEQEGMSFQFWDDEDIHRLQYKYDQAIQRPEVTVVKK